MSKYFSVTPGMSRILGRRAKRTCTNCSLPIPIYPGRYPRKCPHCGQEFDVIDEVVDQVLSQSVSIESLISSLVFEKKEKNEKYLALDKLMQKINLHELLDPLIGIKTSSNSESIWAYFSDSVEEEDIVDFVEDIKSMAVDVKLFPGDDEGVRWVVSILNPRSQEDPEVTGDVEQGIEIQGDVGVQG